MSLKKTFITIVSLNDHCTSNYTNLQKKNPYQGNKEALPNQLLFVRLEWINKI